MLLAAFRSGAVDRRTVAAALAASDDYEGLANTYRFDDGGELVSGAAGIHVFRAEGVRWMPVGEGEGNEDEPLPVGTPGFLSVAACRRGRPHAYAQGGRLTGFGVELAAAIARRLGLALSWRDLPCRTALRDVASGTVDAVLAPAADVPQGALTSGIALSLHVALVTTRSQADEQGNASLLDRLGPDDVVAVVSSAETIPWAKDGLAATGAEVQITSDRRTAYQALVAGTVSAVADGSPRPGRRSNDGAPCGSPRASTSVRMTSSSPRVPMREWSRRSTMRSADCYESDAMPCCSRSTSRERRSPRKPAGRGAFANPLGLPPEGDPP